MTTRAKIVKRYAYLSEEFGQSYAGRIFGMDLEELEAIVGRYSKGKRKGQLKGKLEWFSCVSGGWLHGAGVIYPKATAGHVIVDSWSGDTIFNPFGASDNAAECYRWKDPELRAIIDRQIDSAYEFSGKLRY